MWVTREDGVHVNTDWFDKDRQIAENKRQADEKNKADAESKSGGWDYRGVSERIDKLEASLKNSHSANKVSVIAEKLKKQDELITEELKRIESGTSDVRGDKNALLTQRRRVRQLLQKAKF